MTFLNWWIHKNEWKILTQMMYLICIYNTDTFIMHYIFVGVTLNMYMTYNNFDLFNFLLLQIVTLTKESSWTWITMKDMALELFRFQFQKQMATKTVYIPSDIAVFNSVFYVLSLVDSKKYDIDTFRSIHVPFSLWQRLVLKMFLISTCICDHLEIFFFFFKFHLLKIYSISYNQLQMEATVVIRLRFVF